MAWLGATRRGTSWQAWRGPQWQGWLRHGEVSFLPLENRMKVQEIKWKQNVPTKGIDAEKAHAALETIRSKNNGLTDDAIVTAAAPKNHALHKWFEWDDSEAAKEHRRNQARLLIRSLEVTYSESPDIKTRVYEVEHKARPQDPERTVYTTTEEVLANPESRDRLIAEAIRAAMQFRRRFKMLHELDAVMEAIDKAVETLGTETVA
jgi:hypothetical protein